MSDTKRCIGPAPASEEAPKILINALAMYQAEPRVARAISRAVEYPLEQPFQKRIDTGWFSGLEIKAASVMSPAALASGQTPVFAGGAARNGSRIRRKTSANDAPLMMPASSSVPEHMGFATVLMGQWVKTTRRWRIIWRFEKIDRPPWLAVAPSVEQHRAI